MIIHYWINWPKKINYKPFKKGSSLKGCLLLKANGASEDLSLVLGELKYSENYVMLRLLDKENRIKTFNCFLDECYVEPNNDETVHLQPIQNKS